MDIFIPNRMDIFCNVLPYTGITSRATRRECVCRSYVNRVDPRRYSREAKRKLEDGVTWEITEIVPTRGGKLRWEQVNRYHYTLASPESENAWVHIRAAVLEQFSTPSRMKFEVSFVEG